MKLAVRDELGIPLIASQTTEETTNLQHCVETLFQFSQSQSKVGANFQSSIRKSTVSGCGTGGPADEIIWDCPDGVQMETRSPELSTSIR